MKRLILIIAALAITSAAFAAGSYTPAPFDFGKVQLPKSNSGSYAFDTITVKQGYFDVAAIDTLGLAGLKIVVNPDSTRFNSSLRVKDIICADILVGDDSSSVTINNTKIKSNGSIVMAAGDTTFTRDATATDSLGIWYAADTAQFRVDADGKFKFNADVIVKGAVKPKYIKVPLNLSVANGNLSINKNTSAVTNIQLWFAAAFDSLYLDSVRACVYFQESDSNTIDSTCIYMFTYERGGGNQAVVIWGNGTDKTGSMDNYNSIVWNTGFSSANIMNTGDRLQFKIYGLKMSATGDIQLQNVILYCHPK